MQGADTLLRASFALVREESEEGYHPRTPSRMLQRCSDEQGVEIGYRVRIGRCEHCHYVKRVESGKDTDNCTYYIYRNEYFK